MDPPIFVKITDTELILAPALKQICLFANFLQRYSVSEAVEGSTAYKYQPIEDEMIVSDDEAMVSNQNIIEGKHHIC